jgi:hypothetical protein
MDLSSEETTFDGPEVSEPVETSPGPPTPPSKEEKHSAENSTPVVEEKIASMRVAHEQHQGAVAAIPPPRRVPAIDLTQPLATDGFGRTILNWDLLASTRFDDRSMPHFTPKLAGIDGKSVTLTGYMAPLDDVGAIRNFMLLEIPVGCFYCLVPDPAGIVLVELKTGSATNLRFEPVKVSGRLRLNADDPEDFLYILSDAEISAAE